MPFTYKLIIACLCAAALSSMAFAASPAPGNYQTEGDWGSLTIMDNRFKIFTMGANAHYCDLTGKIAGDKGYTDSEGATNSSDEQCVIEFTTIPDGWVKVKALNKVCHSFCGMRAWFEGTYYLPPTGCASKEHMAARNEFRTYYDAKDYQRAYDLLDTHYKRCGKFMNWIEIDIVRNDLAITQYHLGHKDACLQILQETKAYEYKNAADMNLPPADHDAYLPTAQATWYNLKKCRGQSKSQ